MMASRGCSILGSGTSSHRMSPLPCHANAFKGLSPRSSRANLKQKRAVVKRVQTRLHLLPFRDGGSSRAGRLGYVDSPFHLELSTAPEIVCSTINEFLGLRTWQNVERVDTISRADTMAKPALLPTGRTSSTGSSDTMPNATTPAFATFAFLQVQLVH
jgi:hypothetical protein